MQTELKNKDPEGFHNCKFQDDHCLRSSLQMRKDQNMAVWKDQTTMVGQTVLMRKFTCS